MQGTLLAFVLAAYIHGCKLSEMKFITQHAPNACSSTAFGALICENKFLIYQFVSVLLEYKARGIL